MCIQLHTLYLIQQVFSVHLPCVQRSKRKVLSLSPLRPVQERSTNTQAMTQAITELQPIWLHREAYLLQTKRSIEVSWRGGV